MSTTRMRRRSTLPAFQTKPGRHGTLYKFHIKYRDKYDYASPDFDWYTWAYNHEHAEDRFLESDDTGWKILSVDKMREPSGPRNWT